MHWKHTIDAALLCKAETDGQLPCIDRWPMQAQGQIGSITVFTIQCLPGSVLRSKGLKDATCVGWFGDDWDCSVGSPPEAMDHVSSTVPVGYTV